MGDSDVPTNTVLAIIYAKLVPDTRFFDSQSVMNKRGDPETKSFVHPTTSLGQDTFPPLENSLGEL